MSNSAVILRKPRITRRSAVEVWQRTPLPALTGTSEEVAWATQIRRNTTTQTRLAQFAAELSDWYTGVRNRNALKAALADVLYEICASQAEASWWIDNRQTFGLTSGAYDMVGWRTLNDFMTDHTDTFNEVTMAYGITEYGNDSKATGSKATAKTKATRIETAVIQGVTCARIKGRKGWISLE